MNRMFGSVRAVMSRRILVNFRVRPDVLQTQLPHPFRPKLVGGWGLGGICLIRLEQMRPAWLPAMVGVTSENAAHRIAVEWTDSTGIRQEGVFIPRRDTDSLLNQFAGGRLFPGAHHPAWFECCEHDGRFRVQLRNLDRQTRVLIDACQTTDWPHGSVFDSLQDASDFMKAGCCGWSPSRNGNAMEAVELCTDKWTMSALEVSEVESTFFQDPKRFPKGTVEFDSALLMRRIPHTWRATTVGARNGLAQNNRHHRASAFFELP